MTNQDPAAITSPRRSSMSPLPNQPALLEEAGGSASGRRSDELPDLLTVADLATYLGVTRKAIYRLRDKKKAPSAIWLHGGLRFTREAVLDWVKKESTLA